MVLPHVHTIPLSPSGLQFERQAREYVGSLPWVKEVQLTMTAQPTKPLMPTDLPRGLSRVSNIIAVSSCKVLTPPLPQPTHPPPCPNRTRHTLVGCRVEWASRLWP